MSTLFPQDRSPKTSRPTLSDRLASIRARLELALATGEPERSDLILLQGVQRDLDQLVGQLADELTVALLERDGPLPDERATRLVPHPGDPEARVMRPTDLVVAAHLDTVRLVQEDLDRSEDSAPPRVQYPSAQQAFESWIDRVELPYGGAR